MHMTKKSIFPLSILTMKRAKARSRAKKSKFKAQNSSVFVDKVASDLVCKVLDVALEQDGNVDLNASSHSQGIESSSSHHLDSFSSDLQDEQDTETIVMDVPESVEISSRKQQAENPSSDKSIKTNSVFTIKPPKKGKRSPKIQRNAVNIVKPSGNLACKSAKFFSVKETPVVVIKKQKVSTDKEASSVIKRTPKKLPLKRSSSKIQSLAAPPNSGTVWLIQNPNHSYNTLPNMGINTILVPNPATPSPVIYQPNLCMDNKEQIHLQNNLCAPTILMQNTPSTKVSQLGNLDALLASNNLVLPRPNRYILPLPGSLDTDTETEVSISEAQKNNTDIKTVSTQTTLQSEIKVISSKGFSHSIPFKPLQTLKSKGLDGNVLIDSSDVIKSTNNSDCSIGSKVGSSSPSVPKRLVRTPQRDKCPDEDVQTDLLGDITKSTQNYGYTTEARVIAPLNLSRVTPLKPLKRLKTSNLVKPEKPERSGNMALTCLQNKVIPISLLQDQITEMRKMTTQKKLQNLKNSLTVADIEDVVSERMLNDKIINLGQVLIKVKFPAARGLQDVLLGSTLNFKFMETNFVQIIHCGTFPHWITVSTLNAPPATVYVYDSLNEPVPRDAVPQICNIMNVKSSCLTVISKPMQVQTNNVDCGFFALASTITLFGGKDPSQTIYDVQAMRQHLLSGLMKNDLQEFPTLKNGIVVRSMGVTETFQLICLCRQPSLENTAFDKLKGLYTCKVCLKSYHKQCKAICCNKDSPSNNNS